MALRPFLRPPLSPLTFWRLPSNVRAVVYQNVYSRPFSSTPRPAGPLDGDGTAGTTEALDSLILSPQLALLDSFHAFLPWWAAIPAAAVFLRGFVGYHLSSKQSHKRAMMRVAMNPLVSLHKATASKGIEYNRLLGRHSVGVREQWKAFTSDWSLRKQFDAQYFTGASFVNFAVILCTLEAIRIKTGADEGLIGLARRLVARASPFAKQETAEEPASEHHALAEEWTPAPEPQVTSLEELVCSIGPVEVTGDLASATTGIGGNAYDPTMAVEGLRFCTDLTAPDPTGYLANTILVLMVLNVIVRPSRAYATGLTAWLNTFNSQDGFMICLAVLFWQYVTDIPAGLHLYFLSTIVVARLTTIYCHFRYPIPAPIVACSRRQKGSHLVLGTNL